MPPPRLALGTCRVRTGCSALSYEGVLYRRAGNRTQADEVKARCSSFELRAREVLDLRAFGLSAHGRESYHDQMIVQVGIAPTTSSLSSWHSTAELLD